MDRRSVITGSLALMAGFGLTACQHERREEPFGRGRGVYRYNTPPLSPADGYQYRYANDVILTYHSRLGAYRVGRSNDFYYRGRFYRRQRDQWWARGDIDRQWRAISAREVPRRIRRVGEREEDTRQRRRQRREDAD